MMWRAEVVRVGKTFSPSVTSDYKTSPGDNPMADSARL